MNITKLLTGQQSEHIHWLNDGIGIHREMVDAWHALETAASHAGFSLKIASGFRDFERQLRIWNHKFSAIAVVKDRQNKVIDFTALADEARIEAILIYSALPGTSRHHWGTDIDVYADNLLGDNKLQLEPWEYQADGPFYPLFLWLQQHSEQFGFYFVYDCDRGGVAPEPWHLSYAPLASKYQQALTLELITDTLAAADILAKQAILNALPHIYQQFIINIGESKHG